MVTKPIPRVLVAITAVLGFAAGFLIAQGHTAVAVANVAVLAFVWFAFAGVAAGRTRPDPSDTRKDRF